MRLNFQNKSHDEPKLGIICDGRLKKADTG